MMPYENKKTLEVFDAGREVKEGVPPPYAKHFEGLLDNLITISHSGQFVNENLWIIYTLFKSIGFT